MHVLWSPILRHNMLIVDIGVYCDRHALHLTLSLPADVVKLYVLVCLQKTAFFPVCQPNSSVGEYQ